TYLPATSGVARVAGFDVMNQSMGVRKNIGYLPDNVPLYPELRVEEYLDFRSKIKGVARKDRLKRLEYCPDRCRIREVLRRARGPQEQVLGLLRGLDGAAKVSCAPADGGAHTYQIATRQSKDLRESVVQRLVSGGHGVRRVERKASLRDYFEDLMGEREPAPS